MSEGSSDCLRESEGAAKFVPWQSGGVLPRHTTSANRRQPDAMYGATRHAVLQANHERQAKLGTRR